MRPATTESTFAEQECIARFAAGGKVVVEIGVWHGVNTRRLRQVMAEDGSLYAIDPFPKGRFGIQWEKQIAHSEVARVKNGTVLWVEQCSEQAVRPFREQLGPVIDFIFIDGDHSFRGLETDWTLWSPLVRVGGSVALHDSRPFHDRTSENVGATRYTQEFIVKDSRFKVVDEVDSLTVLTRI
jgi:predicted O-methyltransferase YrrM